MHDIVLSAGRRHPCHIPARSRKSKEGPTPTPIPLNSYIVKVGLLCGVRHRNDRNKGPAFKTFAKFYIAFYSCKDRMILAFANTFARPPFIAALPADDVARQGVLPAEEFHAKAAPC